MPLKPDAALQKDKTSAYSPMEHRHFATIAAIIATLPGHYQYETAAHFANHLALTNPRFDHERFMTACGVWS